MDDEPDTGIEMMNRVSFEETPGSCPRLLNPFTKRYLKATSWDQVPSSCKVAARHTRFIVDGFKYRCPLVKCYFLTHFHSDHYGGLSQKWPLGTIVCSSLTAKLVRRQFKPAVPLIELNPGDDLTLYGFHVSVFEANHCPGAVMFLFETASGSREGRTCQLFTGDFRFDMAIHTRLVEYLRPKLLTHCYLDCTYADPRYRHPSQEEIGAFIANVVSTLNRSFPNTVYLFGSYSIGKERLLHLTYKALEAENYHPLPVFSDGRRSVLRLSELDYLSGKFSDQLTRYRLVSIADLKYKALREIYDRTQTPIVAFIPTGWAGGTRKFPPRVAPNFQPVRIISIPYSEHSGYTDLQQFVSITKPQSIIPITSVKPSELGILRECSLGICSPSPSPSLSSPKRRKKARISPHSHAGQKLIGNFFAPRSASVPISDEIFVDDDVDDIICID